MAYWVSSVTRIDLGEWQARLALHFATLRDSRRARGTEESLFALEHGLTRAEVTALEGTVRTHIASRTPSRDHWLAWVVYAAELGYRYAGDEYWQTFEQETPGWIINGDRYRIRDFYRRFVREFGGAVPSGPWAEHFSIICWPITHAVLPKDLQVQLARTLYECRYLFSEDVLGSPEQLGDLLAARSWNASSRFRNLAEDKRLLGQIAAALLTQGRAGSNELIYPATLQRISEDLDRERQAREWLQRARRSVDERVQIRGLGTTSSRAFPSTVGQLDEARATVAQLGIEPRLVLRPRDTSGESWDILLEVPGLSHLMLRFPQTREILTGCRCRVAGSQGRPLARGRLVHGAQQIRLVRWPEPHEVLLEFERRDPQLDFLLRTECLLRPGTTWLLRIASDGLAYERRGLRVRPGERYVILSTDGPIDGGGHVIPIEVECEGVNAAILDLPKSLKEDWQESIQNLGLGQARGIEVWPVGLSAVAWDGEGQGEWLASERPCLAILADHPLESLRISIDSSPLHVFELATLEAGESLFLELPLLPIGTHKLRFSASSSLAGETETIDGQEATIRILEDRPQTATIDHRGPLLVQIDPPHPTMEQLWDGEVEVHLQGPQNREVACRVSLLEGNGGGAILAKDLPPLRLPVSPEDWKDYFDNRFRNREEVQEAYDRAVDCVLEFGVGELGRFTLRCARPFTPLRWALRRKGNNYMARFYDDSGHTEHPTVSRAPFETPCSEESVPFDAEFLVPDHGGMYVARTRTYAAAIIVPPVLPQGFGLAALGLTPEIERWGRSTESALRVVEIAGLWNRARLPGNLLAVIRRQKVMSALASELFRLVCGDNWARAEKEADLAGRDARALEALSKAISRNPAEAGAGPALVRGAEAMAQGDCSRRVEHFASLAATHHLLPRNIQQMTTSQSGPTGPSKPTWLAELALRLGSDPGNVEAWADSDLRTGLNRLMESPSLFRAARLAVLATQPFFSSGVQSGDLYAGWRWP